ncbi:MAG: hypothetical protein HFE63_04695 [Clostridiales bacterium]|nr:hypothetical protein [Clostridiales bacterium]
MRYFIAFLAAVATIIFVLILNPPQPVDDNKLVTRLKISTYLLDESVVSPSDEYSSDMSVTFEELELGVPRCISPSTLTDMYNINILFEYDSPNSVINVTTDYIQMSMSTSKTPFYMDEDGNSSRRMFGYDFNVAKSGYIAFYPVGGGWGYYDFDDKIPTFPPRPTTEFGHEYFIYVKVYNDASDEYPVVQAELKLVKLKDDAGIESGTNSSDFYSIELISYK